MNQIRIQIIYLNKYLSFLLIFGLLTAGGLVQSADEQYYMYKDGDDEKYVILREDLVTER